MFVQAGQGPNCTCKCAQSPVVSCVRGCWFVFVFVGWRCACLFVQAGQGPTALASTAVCYIPVCTQAGWARPQLRGVFVGWRCERLFVQAGQGPNCTCKCVQLRVVSCVRGCWFVFVFVGWRCACLFVQAGQGPTALASTAVCYMPVCTQLVGWARPQLRMVSCVQCQWLLVCICVCGVCARAMVACM